MQRCKGSILSISANTCSRSSDAAINISLRGVPGKDLNSMKSGKALIFLKREDLHKLEIYGPHLSPKQTSAFYLSCGSDRKIPKVTTKYS